MISIRELKPEDDLAEVLALCKDFFSEYECYHKEFFNTDNLTDTDISDRFLESMESDTSATIVASVNNKIVGYALIAVREQPRFYKIKKFGVISGLMVAKEHRRKGIATMLLEEVRSYFRQRAIKYFTLYTSAANKAALDFYEKNDMSELHMTFIGETGA